MTLLPIGAQVPGAFFVDFLGVSNFLQPLSPSRILYLVLNVSSLRVFESIWALCEVPCVQICVQ
jgi:hypothetical protein